MTEYGRTHWHIESPNELGFIKGEKYWIFGWTWMELESVERTITDSVSESRNASVIYNFVKCEPPESSESFKKFMAGI